jgi:hypothetical protein
MQMINLVFKLCAQQQLKARKRSVIRGVGEKFGTEIQMQWQQLTDFGVVCTEGYRAIS